MAKLTSDDIEKIIKKQMPGYRVVEHRPVPDAVSRRVRADQVTPELEELQQAASERRAGNPNAANDAAAAEAAAGDAAGAAVGSGEEEGEDQMVVLAPENPASPLDHGAKAKIVVVSAKDGKIVTSQG